MIRTLLLGLIFMPIVAHAQLLTGLERNLDLALAPEYPGAGETVSLKVGGFSLDLDRSTITWYANGTQIAKGDGLRTASVQAGALGTETVIEVVAEGDGIVGSARARIRPAEVDLLWQPDSYVPPFFKGHASAGTNARIRTQAIARFKLPSGAHMADKDIIYSWYKNDSLIGSGRGLTSVTLAGPSLFGTDTVAVVAESLDRTYRGRASARINGVDPSVELYENHPLFGILYHRALIGSVATLENEQKVTAVPYFAHIARSNDASLSYGWKVNGEEIPADPDRPDTLTITSSGYVGPAGITLSLTSATDWFLRATGSWEIVFSEAASIFSDPFGSRQ